MKALQFHLLVALLATLISFSATPASADQTAAQPQVFHRTLDVDGLEIFYREAGPQDAPTVLLLHGFPTSSHMFRHLIPALADKYHVVAPDYPGYGNSAAPPVDQPGTAGRR